MDFLSKIFTHIGAKYFIPTSLRFIVAFPVLMAGVFLAFTDMHGFTSVSNAIVLISGGKTAGELITFGLMGLGIVGIGRTGPLNETSPK